MSDLVKVEKAQHSITQLMTVARMLADGEMFYHPTNRRPLREGEVFAIVEYGREVGLEPVMALQNVSIVNGRLCMGGAVMLGIAKQHGVREEFLEETKEKCKVKFEREGHKPYTAEFTMEDANRVVVKGSMKLADKDVWKNYPQEMLKWRAVAKGLRVIAADVLAGLYLPEEVESVVEADIEYTSPEKKHFDQKKNGFLDDDAPVIGPPKEEPNHIDIPLEDEKITDNQLKAYHAMTGAWGMTEFQPVFKKYLYELSMIDDSMSTKSLSRDDASKILSGYKNFFANFLIQEHLHGDMLEVVKKLSGPEKKMNILERVNSQLLKPIDLTTIDMDKDVSDHFSVMVLALQSQVNNDIAQEVESGGMTAEEAIAKLEELGLEPKVIEVVDLNKQQPKPQTKQSSFL